MFTNGFTTVPKSRVEESFWSSPYFQKHSSQLFLDPDDTLRALSTEENYNFGTYLITR